MDNAKILLSNTYDENPGDPDPSQANWSDVLSTFPTPPQNYYTKRVDAAESARHIAIFNPTSNGVTLREVFVEAVCLNGEYLLHASLNQCALRYLQISSPKNTNQNEKNIEPVLKNHFELQE